jgi:hypothetical protein
LLLFSLVACNLENTNIATEIATDHNYFPELPQFTFLVTDNPNNTGAFPAQLQPGTMQARFIEKKSVIDMRESKTQKTAYVFNKMSTGELVYILIPPGIADNIKLIPDDDYFIVYETNYGWPSTYGLIISKEEKLIFGGESAWSPNRRVRISSQLPFTVNQTRFLTNNYIKGESSDFWEKKNNTEISFTYNGNSVNLHQGQSSTLDGYDIKLLIARDIQYKSGWYDVVQNSISYVISRK